MICDCSVPTAEEVEDGEVGCGEECLNRLLMIECGSRCACGESCTNKRFQRRKYADVSAKATPGKGHGLFANVDLVAGDFIMEYVGEVLGELEYYSIQLTCEEFANDRKRLNLFTGKRTK